MAPKKKTLNRTGTEEKKKLVGFSQHNFIYVIQSRDIFPLGTSKASILFIQFIMNNIISIYFLEKNAGRI